MVSLDDPRMREALDEPELPRMSFGDHLDELRSRLIKALLAIVVAIASLLPFHDGVQAIIIEPYKVQWRAGFLAHVDRLEAMEADARAAGEKLDVQVQEFLAYIREHKVPILAGEMKFTHVIPTRTGYH